MASRLTDFVYRFIVEQLEVREDRIFPTADLGELASSPEDLGWCIRKIEIELGISISDEEERSLDTVDDLISCVKEKVRAKRDTKVNRSRPHPVAA